MRRPWAETLVWLVPFLAAPLLYGKCLGLWWSGDELLYLKSVILHTPGQYLFVPPVYRELSTGLFFPGVLLSFDFDHRLFGLTVGFYYAHQLLALALVASLLAILVRRFLPPVVATATALLFLVGPPVSAVTAELMSRHYLEGLAAALAATLLFVRFLEDRRKGWLAGAIALWFLAALCKEVFVPLPLVLVALPVGTWRERLRSAWPFAVGVVVYAAWRQVMVAGALGGYEASSERISAVPERLGLVARQIVAVGLAPQGTAGRALAATVLVVGAIAVVRRQTMFLVVALLLAVAGPLLPVAERLEPRFGLLPWLLVALLAGLALARGLAAALSWRIAGSIVFLAAVLLAVPTSPRTWSGLVARGVRNRAEGEFFLRDSASGDVLRQPLGGAAFYANLRWLRREVLKGAETGRVVYDDVFFCEEPRSGIRVRAFSAASGRVESVSSTETEFCNSFRARRRAAPLTVCLAYDEPFISWEMGPYETGTYWILYGDELAPYPARRSGNVRYHTDDISFRVKYESPEGWLVYSPALRLKPQAGHAKVVWPAGEAGR